MYEIQESRNMKQIIEVGLLLCFLCAGVEAQFLTQYWATFDATVYNGGRPKERLRANDALITVHPEFSKSHREAHVNGLQLIDVDEVITDIKRAEVVFEMWGGHPLTENRRFTINGRGIYHLPGLGNTTAQCEYMFPTIPITASDLVTGVNAFQLACDRGTGFWGAMIVDEMAVRCYLKDDDKRIVANGLREFSAKPSVDRIDDITEVTIDIAHGFQNIISKVHYIARYDGYDDRGDGSGNGWHGYTFKRNYANHVGTSSQSPFSVKWDTRLIPTQGKAMAIKAEIELKNGLIYESEVLDNLWFSRNRPPVLLLHSTNPSIPFWSREGKVKTASIMLPVEPKQIESAELMVRIWDGGEGEVKEPFKLNGTAYSVTSKVSNHDLVFSKHKVEIHNLKVGENLIELVSDTQKHGIEMLLPFPALAIRLKRE
jgi:hypothetical protein